MVIELTSAANQKIKEIRGLSQKKNRREVGLYVVEGVKSVFEALTAGKEAVCIAVAESFYTSQSFSYPEIPVYRMPDHLFEKLCDTKNPQGILAVLKIEQREAALEPGGCYVYCDGVADPGNLGTIIRTGDAAGMDGVLLSPDCADLYNPKTVRSSMGSFFHIPVWEAVSVQRLKEFREQGFSLFGGALCENTVDYRQADFSGGTVLIIGNEANGITPPVLELCTPVKIPIYGRAESLNAGVAAGILMYEAAGARRK